MRAPWVVFGVLILLLVTSPVQAGDAIVFFEVARRDGERRLSSDIRAQRLSQEGVRRWTTGAGDTPIAVSDALEANPATCADGEGGAIVVYERTPMQGKRQDESDLFMQRVDGEGNLLWGDGGGSLALATAAGSESGAVVLSDGEGGAFVVYLWSQVGGERDIRAQHVDRLGKPLWGGGSPVTVADVRGTQGKPAVVADGSGGVIVVFEKMQGTGTDVMARRVTSAGTVAWEATVCASPQIERRPCAVPDGEGGVLVAFELEYRDDENRGDVDVMAQRVSSDGRVLWKTSTEPATVSSSRGRDARPVAVPDGAGGMVVVVEYTPTEGEHAGDTDLLAQRLDGTGRALWNEGKWSSVVSTSPQLERAAVVAASGDGGVIVVFEQEIVTGEGAGDVDVFAQCLSASGTVVWNEGERSVLVLGSTWREYGPVVVGDGHGGLLVVCTAAAPSGEHAGDLDIRAARLDRAGTLTWNEGKSSVAVSERKEIEAHPAAAGTPDEPPSPK